MVNKDGIGWRKSYYDEVTRLLAGHWKKGKLPEDLQLPISATGSMFELGGSKYSSGHVLMIATPSGFPNAAIVLRNRAANGVHVASKVWPGCLIGIAHHQFGVTTLGVFRLESIIATPQARFKQAGVFKKLVGLDKVSSLAAHDTAWLLPYSKTYPGLKKLVRYLLHKLEIFECKMPIYIEPFRIIYQNRSTEPCFKKLLQNTDLLDSKHEGSELTPQYVKIEKNMAETKEYTNFGQLEQELIDACFQYHFQFPYVYLLLCHHLTSRDLKTHAFVCFQEGINKTLMFHRTGYLYHHCGAGEDGPASYELEGYIAGSYNRSYLYTLLGVKGGGIRNLVNTIKQSREGCIYVPLKYALCYRSYR